MLTSGQREKITGFSKKCVEKNDQWHRFGHLEMAAKTAVFLAKREGANPEVCEVAALLHDICKAEPGDHGATGACKAREFLLSIGLDAGFSDSVAEAIHFHDKESKNRSPDGAVVWDADKLYILTPKGFVTRMVPYWLTRLGEGEGVEKAICEYHFFRERINTKTAREIVAKHSELMGRIIAELREK